MAEYGPMRSGYAGLSTPIYGGGGSHVPGWFEQGSNPLAQRQNPYGMNWDDLGIYGQAGIVGQGIGALSDLGGIYAAIVGAKEQRKMNRFNRSATRLNMENMDRTTNNMYRDQYESRNASARFAGRGFESMDSWMKPRQVSGTIA